MNPQDRTAGHELMEAGTLLTFTVEKTEVHEGADPGEFAVEIQLRFPPDPESEEIGLEWGALGFLFVIGVLSFADARPRGVSERDYIERDDFGVDDFVKSVRWEGTALRLSTDYVRGRRMKTELVVRFDGTGTLTTAGRGMAAQHWLGTLQGQKKLRLVR